MRHFKLTSLNLHLPPRFRLACAALLLLPAGCAIDPYDMPGTWRAGDSNASNLAVQVVDKRDLVVGQAMRGSDGILDAAAIDRLHNGKLKPLISTTTNGGSSGGGASGGGAGGTN